MAAKKQNSDQDKLRGGYYTPKGIAEFLVTWAVRNKSDRVLEPGCGDGAIAGLAARKLGRGGSLTAVELFPDEAKKAAAAIGPGASLITGDVFSWYLATQPDAQFDAVIGNPPFIRYHNFPEDHRQSAFTMMKEEGLRPSRLTNAWVPFVVLATRALREGGRLALVLPAELMQVTYAAELRQYLARKYSRLTLLTFRRLVFQGIQQETVLLLGERRDCSEAEITVLEMDTDEDLATLDVDRAERKNLELDHAQEKWIQYYLSPRELTLIREIEASDSFVTLGEIASVDVGIVTGRNDFFVLSAEEVENNGIEEWCLPLVGRSMQIPGLHLTEDRWQQLADRGGKCFLLQLGDLPREDLTKQALSYVVQGERNDVHKGYKCRIRLPRWWNVPSVWAPDAFLLRQIYDGPRIVYNSAGVTCTDTIHRVRVTNGVPPHVLAAASMNSITFAFSEIRGRSYGGGVLELEPTEAEALPFPRIQHELPLEELDRIARDGPIEGILDETDRLLLEPAGLTSEEMAILRGIWHKLQKRRMSRKSRPRTRR